MIKNKTKNTSEGHRHRLRLRFIQSGLDGFLDYEIVELLLTLGTPRKDCKKAAKDLILKFGSLKKILDASNDELRQIKNVGPVNSIGIQLFKALSKRYAKENIFIKSLLDSPQKVAEYIREKYGQEKKEYFLMLYLDTQNNLIDNEISVGILNASLVHPREVFHKAILNNAAQVIVAHNHPSGICKPSDEDIKTTKRLIEAGKIIGIELLDHIIVSEYESYSFRENKII